MLTWRNYLDILKDDGVTLETGMDLGICDDNGQLIVSKFLVRSVDGAFLSYPVYVPDEQEPVSRRTLRQVANALRLPPEKYVFPDEMN